MKILLLIPPVPRRLGAVWFLREERHAAVDSTPTAPYMAPSILGMVRQALPHAAYRVIDAMAERWDGARMEAEVRAWHPDVIIGIVCANHLGEAEERLCIELPYPTIALITPVGADIAEAVDLYGLKTKYFVATDETEITVTRAVQALAAGHDLDKIPGLVINENGKCRYTGPPGYSDMRTYPLPAFDLFPFDKYNRLQDEVTRFRPEYKDTAIINGMKGCPFHCSFCIVGSDATKARTKTGEQIFREVRYLYEHFGRRRFNFLDSEFAANKKTARDFCRLVIDSGLKISFDVKNRIEFWDEDLLQLMKQAGCKRMFYGIETADPRLQAVIRKNLDLDRARKAIAATKRAGIEVHLYMMVGILGETRESLRLNARFIAETKPDGIAWGILFPEVGSPLYEELKARGLLLSRDWSQYRRFDELSFRHDTYRSMDEIKAASVWMRNQYRRYLALDSTLPLRARAAYLARYMAGVANHATWGLTRSHPALRRLKSWLAGKFVTLTARLGGQPQLL